MIIAEEDAACPASTTTVHFDEMFSRGCLVEARHRRGGSFKDGDTVAFVSINDYPKVSDDPEAQVRYWEMRLEGQSHKMAEVLAVRAFPAINGTDTAWNRGRANGNQFEQCPWLGNYYRRIADDAGVSVAGKYYVHGLGRFPGDPRAWCSDTGDALRIARERNLDLDGIVSHRGHDVDPRPAVPLAEDIWEQGTQDYLRENPDARYEDVREKVFNLRTGRDKIGDLLVSDDVPHPADVLAAEGL